MIITTEDDTLIVKELDRLGRNKEMIKTELDCLNEREVKVKILNIPTTFIELPEENTWVIKMVNNTLIEVLDPIAEEKRVKIRERRKEGNITV